MNVSFQLAIADIVVDRSQARQLRIDFQVLTQLSRMENGGKTSISRRALHAANEIMNAFKRVDGDDHEGILDERIAHCQSIAATVLGQRGQASGDSSRQASIWAIGHW